MEQREGRPAMAALKQLSPGQPAFESDILYITRERRGPGLRVDVWTIKERLQHKLPVPGFAHVRTVVLP